MSAEVEGEELKGEGAQGGEDREQRGGLYMAREGEHKEEDVVELGETFAYTARRFGDRVGPEVFLLDCAATSHMVDGSVVLHEEEPISTNIRGVADVQATAVGNSSFFFSSAEP